ncbi:hypothetical protein ALC62_07688 [Cyphomyrmex costatus]|uniref:Uncharacterized protein n=1 Tax=Cyphomyrmex costatus TaxID=456900 RepID=A0A195CLA7_9HYME|nr:hypothetical protein ALC62_07688 [Cyphomyrmex costatus]
MTENTRSRRKRWGKVEKARDEIKQEKSALPVVPLEVRTMLSGRDIETGNVCPPTKRMERGSSARQKTPLLVSFETCDNNIVLIRVYRTATTEKLFASKRTSKRADAISCDESRNRDAYTLNESPDRRGILSRSSFRNAPSKQKNWELSNRTERQRRSAGARGEEEFSTRARLVITGTAARRGCATLDEGSHSTLLKWVNRAKKRRRPRGDDRMPPSRTGRAYEGSPSRIATRIGPTVALLLILFEHRR